MEENVNQNVVDEVVEQEAPVEIEKDEAPEQLKPRRRWVLPVIIIAVLVLGAAAFLGGRLLSGQPLNPFGGMPMMGLGGGKGGFSARVGVKLNMKRAAEIPERTADVHGMIAEFKDNGLMVGTNPQVTGAAKNGEEPQINWTSNDPLVEVVVTQETKIYQDTTFDNRQPNEQPPSETEEIQQTVAEISLSKLEKDNFVQVWGYRRGDRVIAEVLLYNKPVVIRKGN